MLQAGGVEPSDHAGGGGEGSSAARRPRPHREAEPNQREPGSQTRRARQLRPDHRRDPGCVHQGVCGDHRLYRGD